MLVFECMYRCVYTSIIYAAEIITPAYTVCNALEVIITIPYDKHIFTSVISKVSQLFIDSRGTTHCGTIIYL